MPSPQAGAPRAFQKGIKKPKDFCWLSFNSRTRAEVTISDAKHKASPEVLYTLFALLPPPPPLPLQFCSQSSAWISPASSLTLFTILI